MHDDDLSPDADNREAYERLRRTEANRILYELLRRLCGPSEMIEEWLGTHGEGCGCLWCAGGSMDPGAVTDTLSGLRWAMSAAVHELETFILATPHDDAKEPERSTAVRLKPFSTITQAERITL